MKDPLEFDPDDFSIEEAAFQGERVRYRCYRDILYVTNPVSPIQKLNVYVPCSLYDETGTCRYSTETAPIFMPNRVGGYVAGDRKLPGVEKPDRDDFYFWALKRDMVVVSPGVRGRDVKSADGENIGVAPAVICDLKAAVRYIKYNRGRFPGNVDRIITNGTSAGGAVSALQGATGNHPDYEELLEKMGAAKAEDDVYAASCYCPITNLEHADMAYEWEFGDVLSYRKRLRVPSKEKPGEFEILFEENTLSEFQIEMSKKLRDQFPDYLRLLGLTSDELKRTITEKLLQSIQKELDAGKDLSEYAWIKIRDGRAVDLDFDAYVRYRTRMKDVPAFDQVDLSTPENNLFGNAKTDCRHFTDFSHAWDKNHTEKAEEQVIQMMNPMHYIADPKAKKAKFFRIRHGMVDRDTSLAVPALLARELEMAGCTVDFAYPWGIPHAGDYDRDEFFSWVDRICD